MKGTITIPLNVEVTIDVDRWVVLHNTANFDEVQSYTEEFVRNALDAWLISEGIGYVER